MVHHGVQPFISGCLSSSNKCTSVSIIKAAINCNARIFCFFWKNLQREKSLFCRVCFWIRHSTQARHHHPIVGGTIPVAGFGVAKGYSRRHAASSVSHIPSLHFCLQSLIYSAKKEHVAGAGAAAKNEEIYWRWILDGGSK